MLGLHRTPIKKGDHIVIIILESPQQVDLHVCFGRFFPDVLPDPNRLFWLVTGTSHTPSFDGILHMEGKYVKH